ncbi:MAG: oligosaccharide flippase family protein [Actinomycetota bacterium]|nr:oligosaccharide flippase family protein [Actinomycetota bacterium]
MTPAGATPPGEGTRPRTSTSFGGALKWSAVMNVGRQATTLAVTFVLARQLGPTTFGAVALGTVYIALIQMLLQQGMVAALIHRDRLDDDHVDTAFWMVLATSVALTAASVGLASWWAGVNDSPVLRTVVLGLTPLVVMRGLAVVPDALLRRDLAFRTLAVRTNSSVLVGGVVGIGGAFAGWGFWALVAQQLTTAGIELVVLWGGCEWRPRLRFSRRSLRELAAFSVPSTAASLGVFAEGRADAVIVGLYFGPAAVGLYRLAARLVNMAVQSIVGTFRAISLPELARHQRDRDALRDRLLSIVRLSAGSAIVPLASLAAAAPSLMDVLGPEWRPAAGALAVLAVAGAARTVGDLGGPLLQAVGRPRVLAGLAWTRAALTSLTLVAAGALGRGLDDDRQLILLAVATAALHAGPYLALNTWVLRTHGGVPPARIAGVLGVVTVVGVSTYAAGTIADHVLAPAPAPLRLVLVAGAAATTGACFVGALDAPMRRSVAAALPIGRLRRRWAPSPSA